MMRAAMVELRGSDYIQSILPCVQDVERMMKATMEKCELTGFSTSSSSAARGDDNDSEKSGSRPLS
eukprot:7124924-Ditylum_brightwellii.AAC.1